jgi:hypothetical protein
MIECVTYVIQPLAELLEWSDDGDMAMQFLERVSCDELIKILN